MRAFEAFDPWFFANPPDPFVIAGRLVAGLPCFPAFKPERINVVTATK